MNNSHGPGWKLLDAVYPRSLESFARCFRSKAIAAEALSIERQERPRPRSAQPSPSRNDCRCQRQSTATIILAKRCCRSILIHAPISPKSSRYSRDHVQPLGGISSITVIAAWQHGHALSLGASVTLGPAAGVAAARCGCHAACWRCSCEHHERAVATPLQTETFPII